MKVSVTYKQPVVCEAEPESVSIGRILDLKPSAPEETSLEIAFAQGDRTSLEGLFVSLGAMLYGVKLAPQDILQLCNKQETDAGRPRSAAKVLCWQCLRARKGEP